MRHTRAPRVSEGPDVRKSNNKRVKHMHRNGGTGSLRSWAREQDNEHVKAWLNRKKTA